MACDFFHFVKTPVHYFFFFFFFLFFSFSNIPIFGHFHMSEPGSELRNRAPESQIRSRIQKSPPNTPKIDEKSPKTAPKTAPKTRHSTLLALFFSLFSGVFTVFAAEKGGFSAVFSGKTGAGVFPVDVWGAGGARIDGIPFVASEIHPGSQILNMEKGARMVPPKGTHSRLKNVAEWDSSPPSRAETQKRLLRSLCQRNGPHDVWKVLDEQNGPLFWTVLRDFQKLRVGGWVTVDAHPPTKPGQVLRATADLSRKTEKILDPCGWAYGAGSFVPVLGRFTPVLGRF
eukprot:TRINITY_DN763_c0_g2_i1.p1 TRINITY_DN763_c0_g2~~TRINITY_DN763_c0_g2_i1.p1  ORF type:complete len:286 (-),score=2.51 TRINITY_DN763_c0_g2_i1:54-911(-)